MGLTKSRPQLHANWRPVLCLMQYSAEIVYGAQVMEGGRSNFPAALVGWLAYVAYVCIAGYAHPACDTLELRALQDRVLCRFGMCYFSEPFAWPDALVLLPAGLVRRRGRKLQLPTCTPTNFGVRFLMANQLDFVVEQPMSRCLHNLAHDHSWWTRR